MSDSITMLQEPLSEEDIELRVGLSDKYNGKWITVLLYKTARVDRDRLTKVFGTQWQNQHYVDDKGNVVCKIGIYDLDLKQWIWREDTGTESFTEKEKGSYSDSFKRAGFRFGIGVELYKAPTIFLSWDKWSKYEIKGKEFFKAKGDLKGWSVNFHNKDKGLLGGFDLLDKFGTVKWSSKEDKPKPYKKRKVLPKNEPKKFDNKDPKEKQNDDNLEYTKDRVRENLKELNNLDADFDPKKFAHEKKIAKKFNPSISQLRQVQEVLQLRINKIKKEK